VIWLPLLNNLASADSGNTAQPLLTTLVLLVIGSGTGGIIGAIVTWKRFKVEQQTSVVQNKVDLQYVDVEQFKAMFPGGLGDAVEHWRDEAKGLYIEVDDLREQRVSDHDEIRLLKLELASTKRQLDHTVAALARAESRIRILEGPEG
jgi:hypothetical protein